MKLLDYIRGLRKGKEAHRLEKESMRDPFLADAMDGYQQVEGNHEERIKELQNFITARSTKKRYSYAITWSIAACLIIGIGISSYFLFLKNNMPEDTFIAKETTNARTVTPEVSIDPETPKEEIIHSPSAAKKKQDSSHVVTTDKEIKKDIIAKSTVVTTPQNLPAKNSVPIKEEVLKPAKTEKEENPISTIDTLILHSNKKDTKKLKLSANAQNIIEGMVIDDKGQPLVGANITFGTKETDNKDQSLLYGTVKTHEGKVHETITDINGKFTIPKDLLFGKLKVNYIGYDPVSITIKDSLQPILIAMKESTQSKFDEVVITGTGAKKKMTVTGAVTSVNVEDLKQAPSTNVLTGSIPGVIKRSTVKAPKQITPKPVIGMRKYKKYLKENLIPPTDETCSGMKGAIILTFSVNKKGRPNDVKVKKGLCESADKEAIRLILDGPDWTYGNTSAEVTVKFK
ncbi:hypothetical protein [Bacteroides bouchesdurhonensis]|uniref:hypothetical protein n=1 Tax=Bacteroides bouchesdurhonensis TaxID=1841855 RepID=UPI0011DDA314|nr:hypothetical protein [Bacteroides bouchesdurhonensis]